MIDETTRTAEREAQATGDPVAINAAQVAAERAGTAGTVFLSGHVSPETAHVIDDYPYGFRLRCVKRVWIETNKRGSRMVEQTSNPKRPGLVWNKPKAGTYSAVLVLCLVRQADGSMHVGCRGLYRAGEDEAKIDRLIGEAGHALTARDRATLDECRAVARALSRLTWEVKASPVGPIDLGAAMRGDPVERAKMDAEVARQAERKAREREDGRVLSAAVANERAAMSGAALPFPSLGTAP